MTEQRHLSIVQARRGRFGRRAARDPIAEINPMTGGRTGGEPSYVLAGSGVVQLPRPANRPTRHDAADTGVSDPEIAQLVAAALETAMLALRERDPEQFLELRAAQARAAVDEVLASLRDPQAVDPRARDSKAAVLPEVVCGLAGEMVHAISRYAGAVDDETPPWRTPLGAA